MYSAVYSSRVQSIHPSPSGQSNRGSQRDQSRGSTGGYSVFDLLGELQFYAKGGHVGLDVLQAKLEQFDEDSRLKWSRSNYEKEDLKFQRDALKEESNRLIQLNEELREVIQEKVQELEKKEQEHAVDLDRFKKLCDEMVRNISQEKHRGGEERTFEVQVTESSIEGGSFINNTRGEVKRAAARREEGGSQGGIMDEILRLKEELRQNQVKLSQKEKEVTDNSEQKEEIEALKVQIREAEAERKKIIEDFRNSEAERVERYENRIKELEETLEKLKKESQENVKELTAEAEKLRKEAQNLKQEANTQREIAETLRNETVSLKEEIEGLKKEIEGLKKTVSVKEKEAEKLEREVKSIRASASANKEALSEKEFEREETQLELERLRESIGEFEEKLKNEEEKYKKLQEEHQKTLKSEQAHKADVLAKLKDLEGLVEKYAQKEQELEKDLAEANRNKEALAEKVEGSDKKISELEKSLEKSKKSEEESRQKLSHETRRSSGREQEVGEKLKELEDLVEQYRKAAEQNEKALAEANSKADAEKQEKEETLAKIAKLEEELARVKGAKEEHERALNEANSKLEKLQQEKQEMAARIQELEAAKASAGQQGGEANKLTEELEKLQKEGEKKEKEFERLEGEVKKKNDSVEELRREVEEKEKIISGLKVRMGLMTEKVEEAEREAKDFESLRKILREMSENLNMNVKNLSSSPKALTALLTQVKIKLQEVDDKFNQEKEKDVTIRRKLERAESQVLASKEIDQKHKKEIEDIKKEFNEKIEQLEKVNLDLERRLLSQSQSQGENKADDDRERLINHIQSLENDLHGARSELQRLEKEAEKSVSLQEEINRLTQKLQEEQEKWISTREVVTEVITTEEQPREERKMRGARRPLPEEELPKRAGKPNLEIQVEDEEDLVVIANDETAKVELELKKVQEDRDALQRRIEELEAGYGQRMEEMNQEMVKKDEHIVALKFDVDQMKEWITERHGDDVFEKPGTDAGNNIHDERTPVTIYEDREFMKETGSVMERLDSPEVGDDSLSNVSRGILRSPERGSQTSKNSNKKKLKKQNWSMSFKTPKGGDVVSISYDPKQRVHYNSLSAMKFDASENATPRNSERDSVKTTESRRDRRKERENDPAYQQLEKMIMELKEKLVQSEKKSKAEMNQKMEDLVKANNEKEDKLREEIEKLMEEKKALEKKLDDIQWEHTYEIQNLLKKEKAAEEAKDEKAAADGTPKDGEAAKKKKKKKK